MRNHTKIYVWALFNSKGKFLAAYPTRKVAQLFKRDSEEIYEEPVKVEKVMLVF